jgi:hypothetical protein
MSRQSELAALARVADTGALSNRNLIINGAMQVAQRGTSVTGATSTGYSTVDRWWHNASGGVMDISQQSLTVGQTDLPSQFTKFFRFASTQGDNNQGFAQKIENVELLSGKTVTVSFYAKGTNPGAGYVALAYLQNFGSGGSANVEAEPENFILTSSWQRFEITFTFPSVSGKTIGSGSSSWVYFRQSSGNSTTTAWTLDITGVQLEVGDTATEFEHRSYGDELARCQRYFFRRGNTNNLSGGYDSIGTGTGLSTSTCRIAVPYPCEMRTKPTCSFSGSITLTPATGGLSAINSNYCGDSGGLLDLAEGNTSISNGTAIAMYAQNSAGDYFDFDAEL